MTTTASYAVRDTVRRLFTNPSLFIISDKL